MAGLFCVLYHRTVRREERNHTDAECVGDHHEAAQLWDRSARFPSAYGCVALGAKHAMPELTGAEAGGQAVFADALANGRARERNKRRRRGAVDDPRQINIDRAAETKKVEGMDAIRLFLQKRICIRMDTNMLSQGRARQAGTDARAAHAILHGADRHVGNTEISDGLTGLDERSCICGKIGKPTIPRTQLRGYFGSVFAPNTLIVMFSPSHSTLSTSERMKRRRSS